MRTLTSGRVQCRYVYCRRYFQPRHARERFCCPEHREAQRRYEDRKRTAERQKVTP